MTPQAKQRITGDVVILIAGGLIMLGLAYIGAL
jgi:hypothetical protein